MNKVITIYEENHGMIGVATSRKTAAMFLIKDNWFCAYDDIWVCAERKHYPAYQLMGKASVEEVTERELASFLLHAMNSEEYDTCFIFREVDVWEEE